MIIRRSVSKHDAIIVDVIPRLPKETAKLVDEGRLLLPHWVDWVAVSENESEAFKNEQSQRWRKMLSKAEMAIRVHGSAFSEVVASGGFRSQHDTGTSNASMDIQHREQVERDLFGPERDSHPVYGYLIGTVGSGKTSAPVNHYGDVVLIMDDSIRERSTVLAFDSLGGYSRWMDAGEPLHGCPELINEATHRSLVRPLPEGDSLHEVAGKHPRPFPFGYAEVQIHGGVDLSHVHEVVFTREADKQLIDLAESVGLSWSVDPNVDRRPPRPRLAYPERSIDTTTPRPTDPHHGIA